MNQKNFELASKIISPAYIKQASQSRANIENLVSILLTHRKIPEEGWSDSTIELVLHEFAMMDSNNFLKNVGVGDREARVHSSLVKQRNYDIGHGIGRSGEIYAEQPKAAGASLIYKLTHSLTLDALKIAGIQHAKSCLVLPLATGMSLTMCLLAMKQSKPNAQYVLWPRVDQKTCLKCIFTACISQCYSSYAAGLTPIVISNVIEGDEVRTDLVALEAAIKEKGPENILCVLSTTSCFAPRAPDKLVEIATLCKSYNIGHVVNNAYGLQSSKCCHLINEATKHGRVDCFVQSTDKNFLVPVGGAVIASSNEKFIQSVSQLYPGRASIGPILDLFITLLSMGANGYKHYLDERKELMKYFTATLEEFAKLHNERLLVTKNNPICFAMTLGTLHGQDPNFVGSMLFSRFVSGTRTVDSKTKKTIAGIEFQAYGSHVDSYSVPYLCCSCTIGITKYDIDTFFERLQKCFHELNKHVTKHPGENDNNNSQQEKSTVTNKPEQ